MANLPGVYDIFNQQWFNSCQTIWICSDLHLGDKDLRAGFPNRPSDEEIIKNINSKCGKNDCLIVLGDCGDTSLIPLLKAKVKIILLGNHDKGKINYQRNTWCHKYDKKLYSKNEVIESISHNYKFIINEGYQFYKPFEYWEVIADNNLFDQVFEGPVQLGEKTILSHEPIPNITWAKNIHGHSHTGPVEANLFHYNVALEVNNYLPTNLNQLLKTGLTSHIETLHRDTINTAIRRAKKRR